MIFSGVGSTMGYLGEPMTAEKAGISVHPSATMFSWPSSAASVRYESRFSIRSRCHPFFLAIFVFLWA
jgi:hypothetical protein